MGGPALSASDSAGHQMAAVSVEILFKLIGLKYGDQVWELGYGNYPRLAVLAALVTQRAVIATEVPGIYLTTIARYFSYQSSRGQ
jgi:hypothetical protein